MLGAAGQPEKHGLNAIQRVLGIALICTLGINLSHAPLALAGLTHISSRHVAGFAQVVRRSATVVSKSSRQRLAPGTY